ncbi:MAG: GNAT family N-acetyltransferase [Cytophagales bacterium]|uniref:GNAT family N-acetyltransferase n=1 Tax=Microcystis sp. M122S2 TaxID=2771142 RepID=UPI0025876AFD|nr:GNAT family protein [Microcystis sp. M122S2]MCA6378167.1 GNAT family N-acetyltransferase [Cytophagales bacterium]MCA2770970.1 GNAT family N-acetyltransferase [Microcystis sp. M122S2]MCA6388879.1 GNAT family N-acetyltransferase [Cytophagales bacterium]MCA6391109.1 GNAT family N-acetyltransferase [Cytophagales bacterium]MCA6397746.1 GNAT family N-acetyltransferase [Cytophagales bacterium]
MVPKLESERLICRKLSLEHCSEEYVSWLNNPQVNRYLETTGNQTLETLRSYLSSVEANPSILFWAIHLKHNNAHIGNIKIDPINTKHGLGEYGILMGDTREWGKGYAKEASHLVLGYCFNSVKLRKITLGVVDEHVAATTLYKSLGFKVEGTYERHWFYEGSYLNVIRMAFFNPNII